MAITIPFFGPSQVILDKIKAQGNDVEGDYNSGQIKIHNEFGEIIISYKINDNILTVEVLKKPYILSEGIIKEEIIKLF
jgi:hypothetical protein